MRNHPSIWSCMRKNATHESGQHLIWFVGHDPQGYYGVCVRDIAHTLRKGESDFYLKYKFGTEASSAKMTFVAKDNAFFLIVSLLTCED